jgi:hypothetical protein
MLFKEVPSSLLLYLIRKQINQTKKTIRGKIFLTFFRIIEDRLKLFKDEKDARKSNILTGQINNGYNGINNKIGNRLIFFFLYFILVDKKINHSNDKYLGITNPKNPNEHWICDNCSSVNKTTNLKCQGKREN